MACLPGPTARSVLGGSPAAVPCLGVRRGRGSDGRAARCRGLTCIALGERAKRTFPGSPHCGLGFTPCCSPAWPTLRNASRASTDASEARRLEPSGHLLLQFKQRRGPHRSPECPRVFRLLPFSRLAGSGAQAAHLSFPEPPSPHCGSELPVTHPDQRRGPPWSPHPCPVSSKLQGSAARI